MRAILFLIFFCLTGLAWAEPEAGDSPAQNAPAGKRSVYVIPIQDAIGEPNLYLLRFATKLAIEQKIDTIVLDMNTPGGRLDVTLEMMDMLDKFEGDTYTYINPDAISAGAYISASTDEIFFAPKGTIGAAAVITGGGEDLNETAKMKIDSYLKAKVRTLGNEKPYRADVIRAMMDSEFVLEIDGKTIKPAGELLTLTADEAMETFGENAEPLLGTGIFSSIDELLDSRYGEGNYEIREFTMSWSQELVIWLKKITPLLLAIGLLGIVVEFKTPGFGIFGITGITCFLIIFLSNYVAGLAGYEPILFFFLGVVLIAVELFFFPGVLVFGITGAVLIFGSVIWSLADIWPTEDFEWSPAIFSAPLQDMLIGVVLAALGFALIAKFLPKTSLWNKMVLTTAVADEGDAVAGTLPEGFPATETIARTSTDLFPHGTIEVDGKTWDAVSEFGSIKRNHKVVVVGARNGAVLVREVKA